MKKKDPDKTNKSEKTPKPEKKKDVKKSRASDSETDPLDDDFDDVDAGEETETKGGRGKSKGSGDEGGIEKVMLSLSKIFGDREFLSDDELDAFLDSKMASGEIPPSAALDPLDEAQSLIYEAWNSVGPQRVKLAKRALDMSPNCADAYVILAEEDAKDQEIALELYTRGVEAGKRAIDPALFSKPQGHFWDVMETRPYMRARLGLAECLWDMGRKQEGLKHFREMIKLNPSDNQGVRYILLQCLMELGAEAEAEIGELVNQFKDDPSPEIKYTHALWMFRREGASKAANALLKKAIDSNPNVPAYLLKKKKFSKQVPEHIAGGSEEEAEAYAIGALDPWHKTLGALEWLAERSPV